MKTRLTVVLFGLCSLFVSSVVLAHNHGHGGSYAGVPLSGGITSWGDSYGRTAYAGNINLGYVGGYAPAPYYGRGYGPGYGPSCGHVSPYGHSSGYRPGYRHGYRDGRHDRRYNRRHNGGYYYGGRH